MEEAEAHTPVLAEGVAAITLLGDVAREERPHPDRVVRREVVRTEPPEHVDHLLEVLLAEPVVT